MNARSLYLSAMALLSTASTGYAGDDKEEKQLPVSEAHLLGTWWTRHDLGSLDGYQMDRGGKLTLVNLYAWFGDRWELGGDTLTWTMHPDKEPAETAKYRVANLTSKSLTLVPLTSNAGKKKIPLYRHPESRLTDQWVGRWSGAEGSFLDIVPDSARYKIAINKSGKFGEYQGTADNNRIKFTRNGVVEFIGMGDESASREKKPEGNKCLMITKSEFYCRE